MRKPCELREVSHEGRKGMEEGNEHTQYKTWYWPSKKRRGEMSPCDGMRVSFAKKGEKEWKRNARR
jgi:hypothetical protein